MADTWCGSPNPPKMAWAKMREFCWKFTWWCFWVSLFWITSYMYLCMDIKMHICICIIILIWYTWYCIDEQKVEVTNTIFLCSIWYMCLLYRLSPQLQVFWVHRWYRFTWYTHTGSWGSRPLVFSDIFPDPSANYGEFLIRIGEWLMKVIIWRCYQSVAWSTLCLSTYFSTRPTVQTFL